MSTWGHRIRTAREQAGLTQVDLSQMVGVSQSTLSAWERNGQGISDDNKRRLAAALGTDPGELFPWADLAVEVA